MDIFFLTASNVDLLVEFEIKARVSEPMIFLSEFNRDSFVSQTLNALNNPLYASARCLMCTDEKSGVIGRLDFALLPRFSFGGNLRIYVDWVYVLKEYRHKGVAQFLFEEMENYLKTIGINEYFLTVAENEESQSFYHSFKGAEINKQDLLTKIF